MSARVWLAPRALEQFIETAAWWRENRPAAPDLFERGVESALALLAEAPEAGRRWHHPRVRGVRRLLIVATRHHVYYVFDGERDEVEVVAVWSAVRGSAPPLASRPSNPRGRRRPSGRR